MPFIMPMPPWSEIWDLFCCLAAPGLGASCLVMLLLRRAGGERLSAVAAALSLAAGFWLGNHFREAMSWRIDGDRDLNRRDLRTALANSLEPNPLPENADRNETTESVPVPPARYWLPWMAGLAMLVEVLLPFSRMPDTAGWSIRTGVALFAGRLLTATELRIENPWVSWSLGLVILLEWSAAVSLAQRRREGIPATGMSLCFAVAAVVMLYAHSARLMDTALLVAFGLAGPALVSFVLRSKTEPALAAASVFLPGLMLSGQQETYSRVPLESFLLLGLAPLASAIVLLPPLLRQTGWRKWSIGLGLPLIPAAIAAILAARAETVEF